MSAFYRKQIILGGETTTSSDHWSRQDNVKDVRYPNKLVNDCGTKYAANPNSKDSELLIQYYRGTLIGFAMMIANRHQPQGEIFKRFMKLIAKGDPTWSMMKLHLAFQSGWAADDIYNEIVGIFLSLSAEYKPPKKGKRGSFVGFVSHRFPYMVANWVMKQQSDATNYVQFYATVDELEQLEHGEDDDE